jgi:TRAP-type mannitol/chloroaromatic compound transport system permease small subunit
LISGELIGNLGIALKAIGWAFSPALLLPIIYIFTPHFGWLKRTVEALIETIDSFSFWVGEITKWCLPILVLVVSFTVFALSIFGQSWTKLFESADYLHATVIMLGAAATLMAGQHVRVDVFHSRMSTKSRAMVDFIGFYSLLLPVCLIILWNSQSFISFAWRILEGSSESDGIRGAFLLKTLIPAFALMMILQGLSICLRAVMCLREQERPKRPPHTPKFFSHQELEK